MGKRIHGVAAGVGLCQLGVGERAVGPAATGRDCEAIGVEMRGSQPELLQETLHP